MKQKLQVLLKSEQVLNKRLDMVHDSQNSEKQRYEEQLKRMQQEIGKMCDLIQEINKNKNNNKKKKRTHSNKCSKRQRIAELEAQVKDLSEKKTLNQPYTQQEQAKEQVDPNEVANQWKSGSYHVVDTSNPESKLLKN